MLAWGLLAMSMADNVIRPLVIGGRVRIPTVLLLFALLGGLQTYGFLGIVLAPAIVALFLGFVGIYREVYGPSAVPAPHLPAEAGGPAATEPEPSAGR
jgi:predicted PurR-regulated permease PerM